ncbi:MAG: sigma-54 dependent transcriptional regulator [Halothiobacillaceae bacterium]
MPLALIVDDEPDILTLLAISLRRMGIQPRPAASFHEALSALQQEHFDVCLTDLRLPDGDGLMLVRHIQQHYPGLPVAVITAHGDMQSAIDALKSGAFDFVNKPLDLERLRAMVETALRLPPLPAATTLATPFAPPRTDGQFTGTEGSDRLIGESQVLRNLRAQIAKVARSQAPVFIQGESGTGKEVIARLIHDLGPRASKPFVPINCGAIPAELMESELFGHRKGSFTGASSDKQGLFQAAHGGTLFLDEVADLPLPVQVKLLRALQERAVRPVGATREEPVDVRIVSASHKDLARRVQDGGFRQDLFYRLNVIQLNAPALREHPEDIPALARSILRRLAERDGQPPRSLGEDALQLLQGYAFPGNVRELENILERAVALGEGPVIVAGDLSFNHSPDRFAERVPDMTDRPPPGEQAAPDTSLTPAGDEEASILRALEAHRWNRTRAAKALGLTLRQLRYRLAKMGIK